MMKSKTLKAPTAGEGVEQKELSCVTDENAKWYKLLWEKNVAIFFSFFLFFQNKLVMLLRI